MLVLEIGPMAVGENVLQSMSCPEYLQASTQVFDEGGIDSSTSELSSVAVDQLVDRGVTCPCIQLILGDFGARRKASLIFSGRSTRSRGSCSARKQFHLLRRAGSSEVACIESRITYGI